MTSKPSEIFTTEVEAARRRRGWTQQRLAERLEELGVPLDRSIIAKIEAGKRTVNLDELIYFAVALGVPPSSLLLPRAREMVQLTPTKTEIPDSVQSWFRGLEPLDYADERFYFDSRTDNEAAVLRRWPCLSLLGQMQQLFDGVLSYEGADPGQTADLLERQIGTLQFVVDQLRAESEEQTNGER